MKCDECNNANICLDHIDSLAWLGARVEYQTAK